jgi:hypothetical protein
MQTSHKLTRLFFALASLVALATFSFGQVPTQGAGGVAVKQIEVSDQKPGSVLVFPYYTSSAQSKADTRITLSNLGAWNIGVHIFFIAGNSCQQADQFVCLTKGASISFKTSDMDPEMTGYLLAVAVDAMGTPISYNALIGNAFLNISTVADNYSAEAFAAYRGAGEPAAELSNDGTLAALEFNGIYYDRGADQFAVEIQSPNDAPGQRIIHASLDGNLSAGSLASVSQSGTGLLWRGDEKQGSFVRFISGDCISDNTISTTAPRVPTGLGVFLPKGSIGTLSYATSAASVGLLLSPKANAWSGIRTLHKVRTKNSTITIPVYMPVCDISLPVAVPRVNQNVT